MLVLPGTVFGNPSSCVCGFASPIFLLFPGYHASQQWRRETRSCSQSSRCCYSRQDLRIHPTALGSPLLSVCVRALHQPTDRSSTKSRQPKAGVTLQWTRPLTPRWEISEHQICISSPVRAAAKKGSSAWDLERLSLLIPWRKSESRKRDQHCTGILADGYKIFWQVVCLALIGKYL